MKNHKARMLQLAQMRYEFCGIGTKRTKLFLNKISQTDPMAKLLRILLEAEDFNVKAKFTNKVQDLYYYYKRKYIREAIAICKDNNITYGLQPSNVDTTSHIIFFDLPGDRQISFHNTFSEEEIASIPVYEKEWDRKESSTLPKLQATINSLYQSEMTKLRNRIKSEIKPVDVSLTFVNKKVKNRKPKIKDFFSYYKNNTKDNIRASLESVMKLLDNPELYSCYIRANPDPDGVFCSKDCMYRYNFVIVEDNKLEIFREHSHVTSYMDKKMCVKIGRIKLADNPEIKINKTDIVSYQKEKSIQVKEEKQYTHLLLTLNQYENYAKNWESISKSLEENKGKFIEIKENKKGIFWFGRLRCNPVIDENFNLFIHDNPEDKIQKFSDNCVNIKNLYLNKERLNSLLEKYAAK